jgi:hypothetical protein
MTGPIYFGSGWMRRSIWDPRPAGEAGVDDRLAAFAGVTEVGLAILKPAYT